MGWQEKIIAEKTRRDDLIAKDIKLKKDPVESFWNLLVSTNDTLKPEIKLNYINNGEEQLSDDKHNNYILFNRNDYIIHIRRSGSEYIHFNKDYNELVMVFGDYDGEIGIHNYKYYKISNDSANTILKNLILGNNIYDGLEITKLGKEGCFIATAAYGSPMAHDVTVLRKFRDAHLKKTPLGNTFVEYYYRLSPPVASVISKNNLLKTITRLILKPIILAVKRNYN